MPIRRPGSASPSQQQRSATILLVEQDHSQRDQLVAVLSHRGYRVTVAANVAHALTALDIDSPDLTVVDLDVPGVDGIELGRHIGVRSGCPRIMLGGGDAPSKIVECLDSGADDYVVKPYDIEVLLARIRAALRRQLVTLVDDTIELLTCGDITIDTGARTVTAGKDHDPVPIVAGQFLLLATLARNQRRVVTNAELSRVMWGFDGPKDPHQALRVAISKLRRSLGTGPQRPHLETTPRVGYRLVPPPTG